MNSQPTIKLRGISKSFGECQILRNVDFDLFENESVSICGASGIGKTTLINTIGLLERPDVGAVIWNGESMANRRSSDICLARRNMFGFIFQNHNLIHELSVLENVLLPLRLYPGGLPGGVKLAYALLGTMGMWNKRHSSIDVLSGGEKQRVALARALINEPRVILADEPTGNLDEVSANGAIHLMLDVCKQNGSSLLLITHNPKLAELTDKTFIFSDHRVIQR
jgi:lipoprotein-releasing system ATP-binding protein